MFLGIRLGQKTEFSVMKLTMRRMPLSIRLVQNMRSMKLVWTKTLLNIRKEQNTGISPMILFKRETLLSVRL